VTFDRPVFASTAVAAPASGVRAAATSTVSPCSAYLGRHRVSIPLAYGKRSASTPLCGYTPKQLRAIYGLDATSARAYRGRGQTIAVVGVYGAPSMRRDLATFSSRNHLAAASYRQLVASGQRHQTECDPAGWQIEQALDLEAAHAIAPAAPLLYVGARDCGFGVDLALSRVLDGGLATIVSNSWGAITEDPNADALRIPQQLQAAGEGIGLYFASGDIGDGAEYLGVPSAGFPASSPWVTAVGGTATALTRSNRIAFSTGWGDSYDWTTPAAPTRWAKRLPGEFLGGAGGGVSDEFAAPAYQRGVVPASVSGGRRAFSDVAALAAPETAFRIGFRPTGTSTYVTGAVGGTSLAAPIVAAEIAIAQQRGHRVLGFLNPALYGLAKARPGTFRDVRPSTARRFVALRSGKATALFTLDRDSSLHLRKGYDVVTGVGELTASSIARLARP
jgi:subtilase family serine protease